MIVCHCHVVSDREVDAVVAAGARSVAEVCRGTGAGRSCGGCLFSIRQLVCQDDHVVEVPLVEVAGAAG